MLTVTPVYTGVYIEGLVAFVCYTVWLILTNLLRVRLRRRKIYLYSAVEIYIVELNRNRTAVSIDDRQKVG